MSPIKEWFKRMFEALMPSPESNAWDELKRVRAMEAHRRLEKESIPRRY